MLLDLWTHSLLCMLTRFNSLFRAVLILSVLNFKALSTAIKEIHLKYSRYFVSALFWDEGCNLVQLR